MKVGRNQPCPCGSGKKYKKCCFLKQGIENNKSTINNLQITRNVTGELFHPVRLYYKVIDKQGLQKAFHKMKCMDTDTKNERWVWLYTDEAKKLCFGKPYDEIPEHLQPIVIGSFFQSNEQDNEIFHDLRSIERAELAVDFFDKFIGRRYAEITHASLSYRFINQDPKNIDIRFDVYFPPDPAEENKKQAYSEKIDSLLTIEDQTMRKEEGLKLIDSHINDIYPETDKIPLYYDDEGSCQLRLLLRTSLLVATERLNGNEQVTYQDVIKKLAI